MLRMIFAAVQQDEDLRQNAIELGG